MIKTYTKKMPNIKNRLYYINIGGRGMFMLNIRHILERARLYFRKKEIVSRVEEGFLPSQC